MSIQALAYEQIRFFTYGKTLMDGGCSLVTSDGETFLQPTYGFIVGGIVPEDRVSVNDAESFGKKLDEFVVLARHEMRTGASNAIVGTWVDNGEIVFDLCNSIDDEDEALALAKVRGEKAIYDIENQKEIFVK